MNRNTNQSNFLAGIIAGLAAAVLIAMVYFFSVIPLIIFVIMLLVSVPIFLAAFGWGTFASFTASAVATVSISILFSPIIGVIAFILFWSPCCYFAWLLGLAKNTPATNLTEWYPLSEVFVRIAFIACALGILAGFFLLTNSGVPQFAKLMADSVATQMRFMDMWNETDIEMQHSFIIKEFIALVGSTIAFLCFITCSSGLAISLFIARRIEKIRRPPDDWAAKLRLPIIAVPILLMAFALSLFSLNPILSLFTSVISLVLSLAFALTGIAWLHFSMRGKQQRIIVLTIFYVGLCSLVFSVFVIIAALLMGVFATLQINKKNKQI